MKRLVSTSVSLIAMLSVLTIIGDLIKHRNQMPAGVTYNTDGSRTYSVPLENRTVADINRVIDEAVKELKSHLEQGGD